MALTPATTAANAGPADDMFFWNLARCLTGLPPKLVDTSWSGHIPFLYCLMNLVQPRCFVELGVQYGGSLIAACDAAQSEQLQCRLYGIDTWAGDPNTGYYEGEKIYLDLQSYLAERFPTCELIRSTF